MVGFFRRAPWAPWAAGGVVVVVGLIVVLMVSESGSKSGRALPPARARVYAATQACLLAGARGLADPLADAVWAGMQDASAATDAKVSYLSVSGPATVANALPYAASLLQQKCDVVLGLGGAQIGALQQEAADYDRVRFVLIGGGTAGSNVSLVSSGDLKRVRAAVDGIVRDVTG